MTYVIWQILYKDILEIYRNKRALISGLLLPALFIPFLVFFQPYINTQPETPEINIALYDYRINADSLSFIKALKSKGNFSVHYFNKQNKEGNNQQFDLNVIVHQDSIQHNYLKVFYNSGSSKSLKAFEFVNKSIFHNEIKHLTADVTDLNESIADKSNNPHEKSPFSVYPWIFLMFGFSGAAFVASEIITGEKERHTLETLFSLQINRHYILWSKFTGVLIFSMTNFIVNLLIMFVSLYYFDPGSSINLLRESLILFVAIFPALFLLSSILLHIALNAKTIHEARSLESVFFLIFSAVIVSFSFIQTEPSLYLQLIPFINSILIIQTMSFDIMTFILLFISCFVPAFIILKYNTKIIQQDTVLNTVTSDSPKNIPYMPLIISAVIFFLLIRFSRIWINTDYAHGILLSQVIFFFIPSILLITLQKHKNRWGIFKNVPDLKSLLLSMMVTILLFVVINYYQQFINSLFNQSASTELTKTPEYGIGFSLFLLCLLPAVAEEFFFRGYLAGSWYNSGDKRGILISAFIFALFHQNYNEFFGLFILGMWFAYLIYRYHSIWHAVVSHFVNNALVIGISHFKLDFHTHHSVGIVALVLLIFLLRKKIPEMG